MTTTAPIATQNPWLYPLAPSDAPSLSERITRALEAHSAAESHDVTSFRQLAGRVTDPAAKLLIDLIVEDDRHHHSLLESMIRRLHEEVEFVASPTALPVPSDSAVSRQDAAELAANLRELIRDEYDGARHLRHLVVRTLRCTADCTSCC